MAAQEYPSLAYTCAADVRRVSSTISELVRPTLSLYLQSRGAHVAIDDDKTKVNRNLETELDWDFSHIVISQ